MDPCQDIMLKILKDQKNCFNNNISHFVATRNILVNSKQCSQLKQLRHHYKCELKSNGSDSTLERVKNCEYSVDDKKCVSATFLKNRTYTEQYVKSLLPLKYYMFEKVIGQKCSH